MSDTPPSPPSAQGPTTSADLGLDPGNLLAGLELAREAAVLALEIAAHPDTSIATVKGRADFATVTDLAIERAVAQLLAERSPYPVQGEEGTPECDAPVRWAVDPVDGTYNFAAGLPLAAFSIGLLAHGEPQLGVIAHLASGQVLEAIATGPLRLDGRTVHPPHPTLSEAIVCLDVTGACDRPGVRHSPRLLPTLLDHMWREAGGVRMVATAALELAWVAEGRLAAAVLGEANPWDIVAGIALVRAAGGVVLDLAGRQWREGSYGVIAACRPESAARLAEIAATVA